jgi:hypothetical protein
MDNNNLIITTANGFEIIRILNKLGMVDEIVDAITEISTIEKDKQRQYMKIRTLIDEKEKQNNYDSVGEKERTEMLEQLALESPEMKEALKELDELSSRQNKLSSKLMLNAVMKLPQAEKEINKVLASIFSITEKEVQSNGLDWIIDAFKQIATSKTFQSFFKLAIK